MAGGNWWNASSRGGVITDGRSIGGPSFCRSFRQAFHDGDIVHEFQREVVPNLKITGAIVGEPHVARAVFGDQDLERQIDGCTGGGYRDRRPCLRITKKEKFGIRSITANIVTPFALRTSSSFRIV
jgi:hypothetical protein